MIRQSVLGFFVAVSLFAVGCASPSSNASSDDNAATAGASALASDYQGTIGGKPVFIRLAGSGTAITGSYFYQDVPSSGTLVLKGTQTGSKIALSETVNGAGPITGQWTGTVGANGITGTWESLSGVKLPITMTAIAPGSNQVIEHKWAQTVAYTGSDEVTGQSCQLSGQAFEVFGLTSSAAEVAINKALAIDPLDLDASGKCSDMLDERTVTQTQVMNEKGFLTVSVNTESDGGAHPDIELDFFNFRLSDGARFTAKDLFADGAAAQLRTMVVNNINADTTLQASDKTDELSELDNQWPTDGSMDLEQIQFGVDEQGITLDMTNIYPHVVLALAPSIHFAWADLKPVLSATNPYASLAQ